MRIEMEIQREFENLTAYQQQEVLDFMRFLQIKDDAEFLKMSREAVDMCINEYLSDWE